MSLLDLFRPKWKHSDPKVRTHHIASTPLGQEVMGKIAQQDPDSGVRLAAVKKLTDQTILAQLAKHESAAEVRKAAIENLTDQILIAEVSLKASAAEVRLATVRKLSDQIVLAQIAQEDAAAENRQAAVGSLTDESLLAEVAIKSRNADARQFAVRKLVNQEVLAQVAQKDSDVVVANEAVQKLTEVTLIATIATKCNHSSLRRTAVMKLTDQSVLTQAMRNDSSHDVRKAAAIKLLEILEPLVNKGRRDLDDDLATAYGLKAHWAEVQKEFTEAASCYDSSIEIYERLAKQNGQGATAALANAYINKAIFMAKQAHHAKDTHHMGKAIELRNLGLDIFEGLIMKAGQELLADSLVGVTIDSVWWHGQTTSKADAIIHLDRAIRVFETLVSKRVRLPRKSEAGNYIVYVGKEGEQEDRSQSLICHLACLFRERAIILDELGEPDGARASAHRAVALLEAEIEGGGRISYVDDTLRNILRSVAKLFRER